jgi:PAS domain S-box-containing protein
MYEHLLVRTRRHWDYSPPDRMPSHESIKLPSEYDTLHVGIALYDPTKRTILDANERFEAILGYTTDQLRDLSVGTYTANTYPHSEPAFRDRLQASAAGGSQQFTWRVKRADGELIWVKIRLSQQRLAGRSFVRAEMRDITDYYETHHRAELFWRLLRHNMRNEANIILGNTNRIKAHTESDLLQDAATTIQARVENLSGVTESVKEIEQAVTNTDTQYVRRNATAAVRAVVEGIATDYPAAEITLEERAEMGVNVDDAFTHALRHALENAIVHSNEAEPVVAVSVGPSPNTGRVEICITDTNPAIPDDELKALIAPTETTSTSHGSGVGLFVMKWCVESLGGEIAFKTREPQGNTVYIYLPPKTPPEEDADP